MAGIPIEEAFSSTHPDDRDHVSDGYSAEDGNLKSRE